MSLAAAILLSAGCRGESYADKLDEQQAELEAQADMFCDCFESFVLPFESKVECVAFFFTPHDEATRQCLLDAAALYQAASDERIECELAAMRQATSCVRENINCVELNSVIATCSAEREAALATCDPLPPPVQTEVMACTAPPE